MLILWLCVAWRANREMFNTAHRLIMECGKTAAGFKRPDIAVYKDDNNVTYMADHDNKSLFRFSSWCQLIEVAGSS